MGSSLNQTLLNQANALHRSGFTKDDICIALRLKYKGTGTITSVTVDVSTDLEMITSDGGTETFTFAAYATVGALADAINQSSYWEAKILDSLRSEATDDKFIDGAITAGSEGYYDVLTDSDALDKVSYRVTTNRDVGVEKPGGHRVRLSEVKYYQDLTAGVANGFRIYEWDPVAMTETQIYGALSVQTTATTVNFASGNATVDARPGCDLIVTLAGGAFADGSGNFMDVAYIVE
jgi:hypothetical protein